MSTPVTILGTTILWPTQGDVDYSNETTKFANFTAAALAPIQGLITNPTGYTAYLSVNLAGELTVTVNGNTKVVNGTVTSVTVDGSAGRITSSGSPITTSGVITMDLATTSVTPGTY